MNDIYPKISIRFLIFIKKKYFWNFFLRNLNISENNIIGVKLDQVLWYHDLGFFLKKKLNKICKLVHL
jgi:hypothetical protein